MRELLLAFELPENWVAPAVGLISTILVLGIGGVMFRRRAASQNSIGAEPATDPFNDGSPAERRRAARRQGNPVDVRLFDGDEDTWNGWVVDRSVGGLRICSNKAVREGDRLRVRPARATDPFPWVPVVVKTCKNGRDGWNLHLQFLSPPDYNVMLQFG